MSGAYKLIALMCSQAHIHTENIIFYEQPTKSHRLMTSLISFEHFPFSNNFPFSFHISNKYHLIFNSQYLYVEFWKFNRSAHKILILNSISFIFISNFSKVHYCSRYILENSLTFKCFTSTEPLYFYFFRLPITGLLRTNKINSLCFFP